MILFPTPVGDHLLASVANVALVRLGLAAYFAQVNFSDSKTGYARALSLCMSLLACGCGRTTETETETTEPGPLPSAEPQPGPAPSPDPKPIDCSEDNQREECSQCAGCLIESTGFKTGTKNPEAECEVCDPVVNRRTWSAKADQTSCDDGRFCNGVETCFSGACISATSPCGESACSESQRACCEPQVERSCGATDAHGMSREVVWMDSCGTEQDIAELCTAPQQACSDGICACAPGWFGDDCTSCRLHVDAAEGDNLHSGETWEDSLATLSAALEKITTHKMLLETAACEVWMTAGTYYPTPGKDRLATLKLPSLTKIYGGFRGNEGAIEQRVFEGETIVSGDIDRDGLLDEENSEQIFEAGEKTLLDHLVIEGGYSMSETSVTSPRAAGVRVSDVEFSLESCDLRNNQGNGVGAKSATVFINNSSFGGNHQDEGDAVAVYILQGSLSVEASTFEENDVGVLALDISTLKVEASHFRANTQKALGVFGDSAELSNSTFMDHPPLGGMYATVVNSYADKTIVNGCLFENNQATSLLIERDARVAHSNFHNNDAPSQPGIWLRAGDQDIVDCEFRGNRASEWWSSGSGVSKGEYAMSTPGLLRIIGSRFYDNSAGYGGAVYVYTDFDMGNAENPPQIVDCAFEGNRADYGGAVEIWGSASVLRSSFIANRANERFGALSTIPYWTYSTVRDSLFVRNTAPDTGAIGYGALLVENSTFAFNESTLKGGIVEQNDSFFYGPPYCSLDIRNSIFWDNLAPENLLGHPECEVFNVEYSNVQGSHPGTGNLNLDPLFVDAPGGDFRLSLSSPLRDAGNQALMSPDTGDEDLDGNLSELRPFDLAKNPRLVASEVDMGAYEVQPESGAKRSTTPPN